MFFGLIFVFICVLYIGSGILLFNVLPKLFSRKFKLVTLQKTREFFNHFIVICILVFGITFFIMLILPENSYLRAIIAIIWCSAFLVFMLLAAILPYSLQEAIILKKIDNLISTLVKLDCKNASLELIPIKAESPNFVTMLNYDIMKNFAWELKLLDQKKKLVRLIGKDCLEKNIYRDIVLNSDNYNYLENSFALNI